MKTLLASTAIALGCVGMSHAASHEMAGQLFVERVETQALRASDLMGKRIYASGTEIDPSAGLSDDWNDIGAVEDVILGDAGGIDMIVTEIGGFLGLGEREVALDLDQVTLVPSPEAAGGFVLVLQGTRSEIENAPAFDDDFPSGRTAAVRAIGNEGSGMTTMDSPNIETVTAGGSTERLSDGLAEGVGTDTRPLDDGTVVNNPQTPATAVIADGEVEAEAPSTDMIDSGGDAAGSDGNAAQDDASGPQTFIPGLEFAKTAPMIEREGYSPLMQNTLRLPELAGVPVFDTNDTAIGDISYAFVPGTRDSEQAVVVVSIGGFLGIGDHEVAMRAESMTFVDGPDGIVAYVDATREELETLPEYEG
ncbi:hypothetical protein [Jannaschia ovalis]|uniref:PRC-barrel domain-containing protein n=1 Tax=Jannaschia ovalis TaxID=3038773 RepID=A0ABY8LD09_9RHOB|nr:hypothetical protein [Jannaschia sp. GRR-S6-38]WGH77945.1 hypothetical protein P8627_13015 [Jannaschia sp. GRR-S6-38]